MPFVIERFGGTSYVRGARIQIRDGFTLSDGLEICQLCHPTQGRFQLFFFDFSGITTLNEDVVAWLSLFLRWAEEAGISARLQNLTTMHRDQLARIGISEHGTAMCDVRTDSFRQLLDWADSQCVMDLAERARGQMPVSAQLDRIRDAFKEWLESSEA